MLPAAYNRRMSFLQSAAVLGNTYVHDRVLRGWLAHALPRPMRATIDADLDQLGALAADAWSAARTRNAAAPALTQWDAWGHRIDRIELTPVWQGGRDIAARYGLVAAGHDPAFGEYARCDQFARVYLQHVASEFFTCPLAMTDGAATALKASGNRALIERIVPRLVSRDPSQLWLSGQWMTETAGGSDVGRSETLARLGEDGQWRLHGRKWFTSAVTGEMALTLARPHGAGQGARALAMFLVQTRDGEGHWNGIRIDRLKDKLGTRELPTAEITLDGALAEPVGALEHGVRLIAPMLNVTRTWNAVCALATMRRAIDLATDYAHRRTAFGKPLIEHPLHAATLAGLQAQFEAAFALVFHVTHLLGRDEHGVASDDERAVLRLLTPLAKLWTGKLAIEVASECCEAFGGAGYIEDTGLPLLLRDAQVYPIWEGTTNVLALDALRAIAGSGLDPLQRHLDKLIAETTIDDPHGAQREVLTAIGIARAQATDWLRGKPMGEAGARAFALTLARVVAATLLARHSVRVQHADGDRRPLAALVRFVRLGLATPMPDDEDARILLDRAPH